MSAEARILADDFAEILPYTGESPRLVGGTLLPGGRLNPRQDAVITRRGLRRVRSSSFRTSIHSSMACSATWRASLHQQAQSI